MYVRDATGRGWPALIKEPSGSHERPLVLPGSPRRPATNRESRWSSHSRYCLTAEGRNVSTFAAQSEGGHWSTWAPDAGTSTSLHAGQTRAARMPWINTRLSSKDSLAMRPGQNEAQQSDIRACSERKAVMPVSFFTDLSGHQRMIKPSSKVHNNPFHTARNPLPVGWGMQNAGHPVDGRIRHNTSDTVLGQSRQASSQLAPEFLPSTPGGNIVRELVVAVGVQKPAAIRAAKATGHSTVAAAMKWLLDNDSGAVAELEQRSRERYFSSKSHPKTVTNSECLVSRTRKDIYSPHVAQEKHATVQRFLNGQEKFSGGRGGRLGPGGWLVGGGLKAGAKEGNVEKAHEKTGCLLSSDAGSICVNMETASDSSWTHASSTPALAQPVIAVIPRADEKQG